jgi:hypothetical protein
MKRYLFGVLIVLAFAGVAIAQEPQKTDAAAKTPALTDVQKLQIQNLAQRLELTQTQIRAAQLDYERTAQTLTGLLQALQVPGYDLNLQTLTYTPKPEPAKKDETTTPPK